MKTLQMQANRLGLSTDMLFAWKAYLAKLYGSLIPSLKPSDQSGDRKATSFSPVIVLLSLPYSSTELDHIATMIAGIHPPLTGSSSMSQSMVFLSPKNRY